MLCDEEKADKRHRESQRAGGGETYRHNAAAWHGCRAWLLANRAAEMQKAAELRISPDVWMGTV